MARPKKGTNTFKGYQEDKQARREALIQDYLKVAQKSRARFKYVTDLAKMVAVHISQVEGNDCNQSTLLRNPRYKTLLLSYLADELQPGAKNLDARPSNSPSDQVQITQLQLTNRNLVSENQRLKAHLASLKDEGEQLNYRSSVLSRVDAQTFEADFVHTCQALLRLLQSFDDLVSVDIESNSILDLSRRTDNIIADARLAAPFVAWLLANRKT